MKKLFYVLCGCIALVACNKINTDIHQDGHACDINFNLSVNYPVGTKAVKSGWEDGDIVFIFFQDVTTGYVTMKYNGSSWETPVFRGHATISELSESGKTLTALYRPFITSTSASYDNEDGWFFPTHKYTYYMVAEKVPYTVSISDGITTLSATINMTNPEGFVQFFIEDPSPEDEAYELGIDAVYPARAEYVSSDGTVSEYGLEFYNALPGYAVNGGYIFSGKLENNDRYVNTFGPNYYFTKKRKSDNSRADFFTAQPKKISSHDAIKLPANNSERWLPVGKDKTVNLKKGTTDLGTWHTCNYQQSYPENAGDYVSSSIRSNPEVKLPTKDQYDALLNKCEWYYVSVHAARGRVVLADNEKFIFLPDRQYWTSTYSDRYDCKLILISGSNPKTNLEPAGGTAYVRSLALE